MVLGLNVQVISRNEVKKTKVVMFTISQSLASQESGKPKSVGGDEVSIAHGLT